MKFDRDVIQRIPSDTPNHDLVLKSLQVREALAQSRQWGLANVVTGLKNSITNPDPSIRAKIQRNVDELAQATGLFYCFSIWDEAFSREDTADILDNHLDADMSERFRAYKHMRNSVGHFYNGRRAKQNSKEVLAFDNVMASNKPFPNVSFGPDEIDIAESMVGWDCLNFLEQVATELVGRLANP